MKFLVIIFCLCFSFSVFSQTLGGNAVYNFLKLPSTPLLTSAGGANVSFKTNDAGLAANNPALLNGSLHKQISLVFNGLPAGIKAYSLTGAYYYEPLETSFGGQIYFVSYGSMPQTDASGNESGSFHPVDFVIQVSGAKTYLEKWSYGATLKFIQSSYGIYRSSGLAVDVGLHFEDTANQFYAGFVAKNMGFQLKSYSGDREDLPFDLQLGVTKRLENAPFGFSFTAQHLQRFDIFYEDTTFNNDNDIKANNGFVNKLLNHFVVASHIYVGNNLEATIGYSQLRRTELNIGNGGNGLNGFSMGLRLKLPKMQVLYSRSHYQRNISYNQLGLTLHMDKLFGLGKGL